MQEGLLLSYAKSAEYLAEQVVGSEFAGDRVERLLREAQLFGKKFGASEFACRLCQVSACKFKRPQMAFARHEYTGLLMPADQRQQALTQRI